jgi:prevent-host-death family protein
MKTYTVAEVKAHLSAILKEVQAGHEIGITFGRAKETIAVIVPKKRYEKTSGRVLGSLEGKMKFNFSQKFKISDEELLSP